MPHPVLNYDPTRRHDFKVEDAEARQESSIPTILQQGETVELPPTLLIQGTADTGVPQGMVEGMKSFIAQRLATAVAAS